jgi:hypothetical protein
MTARMQVVTPLDCAIGVGIAAHIRAGVAGPTLRIETGRFLGLSASLRCATLGGGPNLVGPNRIDR